MSVLFSIILSAGIFIQDFLPKDERGLITYYEVVELSGYPHTLLFDNAKSFLKDFSVRGSNKKHLVADKEAFKLSNKGSYKMSNMFSLGKHVDGIVIFDMDVEIKEGRYRYIVSNFTFQEFERDRYGKFNPVRGSEKPLETQKAGLSAKQWEIHQQNTDQKIQQLITDFKIAMASVSDESKKKKKDKNRKRLVKIDFFDRIAKKMT